MANKFTASELQIAQLRMEVDALERRAGKEDVDNSDSQVSLSSRKISVSRSGGTPLREEPNDLIRDSQF